MTHTVCPGSEGTGGADMLEIPEESPGLPAGLEKAASQKPGPRLHDVDICTRLALGSQTVSGSIICRGTWGNPLFRPGGGCLMVE